MRFIKYILLSGLILMLWGSQVRAQESPWTVCAGAKDISYFVEGWEGSTFDWTVEGGVITQNFGDSIVVDWPRETGSFEITVQETSADGCAGEVRRGMVEVVGPDVDLGGDTYFCFGESIEINLDGEFSSYLWHDGSTASAYITDQEGWIRVEVSDDYGCTDSDSIYITERDLPVVDLGNDTALCGSESLLLDGGPDGEFFTWSTGDASRTIRVYRADDQEIWVEVEDAFACINRDTILIRSCNMAYYFRDIPSGITPNSDGRNDYWEIDKLFDFNQAIVEIYNQWGILIWKSEPGYSTAWDGNDMNGNPVPVDSYHFIIDFNDGDKDPVIGIVTVIR